MWSSLAAFEPGEHRRGGACLALVLMALLAGCGRIGFELLPAPDPVPGGPDKGGRDAAPADAGPLPDAGPADAITPFEDAQPVEDATVDADTDADAAPECAFPCENPHGTGECVEGTCVLECDADYADCDFDTGNGCETDLAQHASHCGGCGNVCGEFEVCEGGACVFSGCTAGLGECDDDLSVACETDLLQSVSHCGACGNGCTALEVCDTGTCAPYPCDPGFAECDQSPAVLCETNLQTAVSDCGACGNACVLDHATPRCDVGTCAIQSCESGYDDCDGEAATGCETDLLRNPANCGGCGIACTALEVCDAGTCVPSPCDPGFAECDQNPAVLCEANVQTSVSHCGYCDNACTLNHATPHCSAGSCTIQSCHGGYDDCDGLDGTGCEANLSTSTAHCGGCGLACSNAHGTTACDGGTCDPTCQGAYDDCDGNTRNGCETALSTVSNCGACGRVCPAGDGTAVCNPGGSCAVECDLTGTFALALSVPVSWSATSYLHAGSGTYRIWMLAQAAQSGTNVSLNLRECGRTTPPVSNSYPFINESYLVEFPHAIFDSGSLPTVNASATLTAPEHGAGLSVASFASLLGITLGDPFNGAWPSDGPGATGLQVDMDGNGKPGVSTTYANGSGYYNTRTSTSISPTRADRAYAATRTVVSLSGNLSSCTEAAGSATFSRLDTRFYGCRLEGGGDCNGSQANMVDDNVPTYQRSTGSFALRKISNGAGCAQVRAAYP